VSGSGGYDFYFFVTFVFRFIGLSRGPLFIFAGRGLVLLMAVFFLLLYMMVVVVVVIMCMCWCFLWWCCQGGLGLRWEPPVYVS